MARDRKQDEINLRNFQNRIVEEDDFNNNRVPLGGEALGRYIQNLNAPEMEYQQPVNLVEQVPGQGNISYAQDSPNYANYGAIDPQIQFEIEETERQALEEEQINQMISTIPVVEDEDKANMVKEVEKTPEIQALPRAQRKQVATQAVEESLAQSAAQSAEQAVQQTVQAEAKDASPGSLKSKWLDAVKYFSPQLVGMAVGGVLGGRRGAIAGYEEGKGIRKGLDDMGLQFQKLNQQALKQQAGMMQVSTNTDLYDTQTGNIVQTNKMGQFISNGQIIPPERVGNLKVDREARTANYQQQRLGIDAARLEETRANRNLRLKQFLDKQDEDSSKKYTQAIKSVETNKVFQTAEGVVAEADTIRELVKDANTKGGQSLAMLGPRIAKGIAGEVGVLTEQDVTRYVTNPAAHRAVADKIAKVLGGRMTNNSAENILRLVDIMEDKARSRMADVIQKKAKVYGATTGDFSVIQLQNIMTGKTGQAEIDAGRKRMEELRRKARGK